MLLRHPAGSYTVIARAFGVNGVAIDELSTAFQVSDEPIMSGGVVVDPPLVQAGAATPVQITAQLNNLGNQPIPAGELELAVVLDSIEPQAVPSRLSAEVRGLATSALLGKLRATAIDHLGNIYGVTGLSNDGRVVKITKDGETVAVRLPEGYPHNPQLRALALDGEGGLWIGTGSAALWHVDSQGAATRHALSQLSETNGIDRDPQGNLHLTGRLNNIQRLIRRTPDGTESVLWENGLSTPTAVVKNAGGELLVTNHDDGTVVRVRSDGAILPFVRGLDRPKGITADAAGNFFVANSGRGSVVRITPQGELSEYARGLKQPTDLRFDSAGRLYVSCAGDHSIRRVERDGTVTLFAQGIANSPTALAYASTGELYITNRDGTLRVLGTDGIMQEAAQGLATPYGLAIEQGGTVLVTESGGGTVVRVAAGAKTSFASGLVSPMGIAVGGGQVVIAEYGAHRLARYDTAGVLLERIESVLNLPSLLAVDSADRIIVANHDRLSLVENDHARIFHRGLSVNALVPMPGGAGVYVAAGYDLRRVAYDGSSDKIKTLTFLAEGLALDAQGDLVVLDRGGKKIHKLDRAGNLAQLASLPATPSGIVSDEAGQLYMLGGDNVLYALANDGALVLVANLGALGGGEVPAKLAIGRDGHPLVITNWGKVLSIDPRSGASTLRKSGSSPSGATTDSKNTLYLSLRNANDLVAFDGTGTETTRISGFNNPTDVVWDGTQFWFIGINKTFALDSAPGSYPTKRADAAAQALAVGPGGALYGVLSGNISKWNGTGWTPTPITHGAPSLDAMDFRADGAVALASSKESSIFTFGPDWSRRAVYAGLVNPVGLAFDAAGRLYAAGKGAGAIARFAADAPPNAVPEIFARVPYAGWLAFDSAKQLWVTDSAGLRRIDESGAVSVVAPPASGVVTAGVIVDDVLAPRVLDSYRHQLLRWEGGAWRVEASGLAQAEGLRAMPDGSVLVVNAGNGTVVRWQSATLDVVVAGLGTPKTLALGADGQSLWVGGEGGTLSLVDGRGEVESIDVSGLINEAPVRGIALGSDNELILVTDAITHRSPTAYSLRFASRTPPPPLGTVVHEQTIAIPAIAAAEGETQVQFQSWIPPWGGDYRVTVKRAGVPGDASGRLHAGPFATATLATKSTRVAPRSQTVPLQMKVVGADFTSIARVEVGLIKSTVKVPRVQGMVSDRSGTIFYTASQDGSAARELLATTPDGQTRTVASGHTFGMGLAIDSQERLYAPVYIASPAKYQLLRFDRDGNKIILVDNLGGQVGGVAVNSRDEILVALTGKLLKVTPEGAVAVAATAGLPSPVGVSVDGKDNIYVLNHEELCRPDQSRRHRQHTLQPR